MEHIDSPTPCGGNAVGSPEGEKHTDKLNMPETDFAAIEPAEAAETLDFDAHAEPAAFIPTEPEEETGGEPANIAAEPAAESAESFADIAAESPLSGDLFTMPAGEERPAEEADEFEAEEKESKFAVLLQSLKDASPYTVLLGLALTCLVIGALCLLMEWKAYDYEIKPKLNKPAAAPAAQSGPAITRATA
jgi:hypothetical protein